MSQTNGSTVANARRELIERVAASPYLVRSARLRDLLLYLSGRVLEGETDEIHEQEVGHKVFGRPLNYDTSGDNIVRVHASTLRKRLEQYFSAEGATEPLVVEIPKGNYAPVFRERPTVALEPPPAIPPPRAPAGRNSPRLIAAGIVVACLAVALLAVLARRHEPHPAVREFWSQLFAGKAPTNIVLDDSALALYQETTGKSLALSDYFDRGYLRSLPDSASTLVMRRQSSFAGTNFFWHVMQIPEVDIHRTLLRFARDFTFRDLKTGNTILLGNATTNPWVQPFESKLGLRWRYDAASGTYSPVDLWNKSSSPAEPKHGYFSIALLPNLGDTGSVLIVSGTGGSALNSGAEFLADDAALSRLKSKLPATRPGLFPYFEALIGINGRSTLPRDANIVFARQPATLVNSVP